MGFLAPRNLPMHKMRPKLSFCRVNFAFRCILGHFGPILGPMTSLKGPRIEIFISSTSESYSLHQKTYQCIVFGSRTLFYERLLRYQCQILIKKRVNCKKGGRRKENDPQLRYQTFFGSIPPTGTFKLVTKCCAQKKGNTCTPNCM